MIMTDIELQALTELVHAQLFEMQCANKSREIQGKAPAYGEIFKWESRDKLEEELERREIL
jgi:hypothetical protein